MRAREKWTRYTGQVAFASRTGPPGEVELLICVPVSEAEDKIEHLKSEVEYLHLCIDRFSRDAHEEWCGGHYEDCEKEDGPACAKWKRMLAARQSPA